ncbi:tRNA 5-methylaminomethyl-2-thiouridine synthase [Rhodobacteraceae bacterium RKSG542]|uniref:tRNA (5-methylaminomethyl-2-thiouridine)(34)-methyltransferase MnmD n=1 Tax=Pseudovibrio flavus TaxID=2529854 RepID=UPI0012BC44C6|nr:tRNA (5-methylaminomethyl-2-thiouridine)(34)-methyltransferase MnmD [Pseudovibrio flavus]MTI18317.1 tRNA 5-methylaminomethyl-2-thiouridine synthase [Pseudovibrio flavus]
MTDAPKLEWKDGDLPVSSAFGDTYYSKEGGRDETNYVFLRGNRLPERFLEQPAFTIAELGFGTGLNFFETCRQLRAHDAEQRCHLTFVSFELHPLPAEAIRRAMNPWPDLATYMEASLAMWTVREGWNTFELDGVTLKLGVGDARELLPAADFAADAWYLDGFNPSLNTALWELPLMQAVYGHTRSGGSFATYTAAGWVRRNLKEAGFTVEREKGFGRKREMMRGTKP